MADHHSQKTHTQRLSRQVNGAYEAHKAGKPGADTALHGGLRALADHILRYRLWPDEPDPSLEYDVAHKAFLNLSTFRGKGRLSTWFYRIVQNAANDELRKRERDRKRFASLTDQPRLQTGAASREDTLGMAESRKTLPPEQADVVELVEHGLSLAEIAEKLGVPLGTVRGRWRLAKQKLKAGLA